MVPHLAAREAHQRLWEFSIAAPKRLLQQYPPEAVVPTRSALKAKRTWRGRRFERLSIIALACAGWPAIAARRSSELVRAPDYFSLVSGFVIARTLSMKTCVARLRDRFFSSNDRNLETRIGKIHR